MQGEVVLYNEFGFKALNNEAEYEVIIVGLRMWKALGAKRDHIKSDSQLVVSQVASKHQVKKENTKGYLGKPMSWYLSSVKLM